MLGLGRFAVSSLSAVVLLVVIGALGGCKPKTVSRAEADKDVKWLTTEGSPESIAALGRLADTETRALTTLESRAGSDVNTYIAAWSAVTRNAAWGTSFLKSGLADPTRAEMAASALPRGDARLVPLIPDLDGALVRLAAGKSGSLIAGILASIGPAAHATVEKRLLEKKTRGAMCDGISLPEASADAKALVLSVPADGRDNDACVGHVLDRATNDDQVLAWLATKAEPGLINAAAKGTLACPRMATMWRSALAERPQETHVALWVPLQRSLARCSGALDAVLADLLAKAPRARTAIVQAIDPFSADLVNLRLTCAALREGYAANEPPRVRERARDAVTHGCTYK